MHKHLQNAINAACRDSGSSSEINEWQGHGVITGLTFWLSSLHSQTDIDWKPAQVLEAVD